MFDFISVRINLKNIFFFRISTSSHFEAHKYGMTKTHNFPLCRIDEKTYLNIQIKWLKKDNFPEHLLRCYYQMLVFFGIYKKF